MRHMLKKYTSMSKRIRCKVLKTKQLKFLRNLRPERNFWVMWIVRFVRGNFLPMANWFEMDAVGENTSAWFRCRTARSFLQEDERYAFLDDSRRVELRSSTAAIRESACMISRDNDLISRRLELAQRCSKVLMMVSLYFYVDNNIYWFLYKGTN